MFCNHCGRELRPGAQFCEGCGAPVSVPVSAPVSASVRQYTRRVTLWEDGKYHWIYEMSLFKNPTIFWLLWKIFFFTLLGIFGFMTVLNLIEGNEVLGTLRIFGWFVLGMTALVGVSYLIYAAIMGGKYVVEFDMDDRGVHHRQTESQARKARRIGRAAALAGAASGSLSSVGVGINAQRTEMYSEFAKTRKVIACPRRSLIKVNGLLEHNQVYAPAEDFAFVRDYITARCPGAKCR